MNPSPRLSIQVGKELDVQDIAETVFADEVARRRFCFVRAFAWETSERELASLPGAVLLSRHLSTHGQGQETFLLDDALCYLQLRGDDLFLRVAGHTEANVDVELLMKSFYPPVLPRKDRCEVEISFWRTGANGPRRTPRTVEVEAWSSIEQNYSSLTRSRIEPLVEANAPPPGGRILLWHGDPGTGKTRALQSLAWEWRTWANFHYITDPENLFGEADYMMDIVLSPNMMQAEEWRVLVLEDTGELLTPDAKLQTGQGLSRLLNLTDGFIGRLTRIILLVTTNEELGRLHPAVARPGRCAARVEFLPFSSAEAREWLLKRGQVPPEPCPGHLADLYAALETRAPDEWKKKVGFAPA